MKVLHVIPSVSRVHGGPSVALETMTRALADAGLSVEVATTDDDGAGRLDVPPGHPVLQDKVTYWYLRRQTHFYKFSLPLTRWLAREIKRFDVVHIHALFSYASIPAAFYSARQKIPYIVRPLGTLNRVGMEQYHRTLKRVSFPLIESKIIENAAYLHFTSELERTQARDIGIVKRSVVIPIGVEWDEMAQGTRGDWRTRYAPQFSDCTLFLFLGRLDPIKGLDVLLPAFARLQAENKNVALIIAGEGEPGYEKELRRAAAGLGIQNYVLFPGYVQGKAKHDLLRDADVFVLPSRSENQGVAVVEAMAAGLPVIVTPEVGIAASIAGHGAGTLVSADPRLLGETMQVYARGDDLRRESGARARQLARTTFSVEAMRNALIELYRTVSASKE